MDIFELELKKYKVSPNYPFLGYYVYKTKCMTCSLTEYFFEKNSMILLDMYKDNDMCREKEVIKKEYEKLIKENGWYLMIKNQEISDH